MKKVTQQEEIDLLELFLRSINIVRANFWLIILFFFIGTALGIGYYFNTKKVYESNLVLSSSILTESYSKNLIENLNRYKQEMNIQAIMSLLNVSDKTARGFIKFEIESLQIEEVKENDRFIITAKVSDPEIFPELQKGLVQYLENNEFVKVRVEQNRSYLKQMVEKLDSEIRDMEEFKQRIIKGDFFQSAKGNVMFDPTTVNSKILELTKDKINLENNLALGNSVYVIEGFSKFERPSSPRLSVSLVSGSLMGLFFVSILIAFKSIRRVLRMADAAKQNS